MHARSLSDALTESYVHLLVACCFTAVNALPASRAIPAPAGVQQDTTAVATDDAARSSRGAAGTPVAALGSVEASIATSFAMTERMMAPFEARADAFSSIALVGDSLLDVTGAADTTTRSQRPRAIEYSDAYHTRLKIHQIGAYVMLPLFVGEYFVGQKLLNSTNRPGGLKSAHSVLAGAVGVVFATNTVTGVWNFWDARKDPKGRTRREIHSVLMLASDAGVLLTAISGSNANHSLANARTHRTIAISSIALSAIGTGMMWLWRN